MKHLIIAGTPKPTRTSNGKDSGSAAVGNNKGMNKQRSIPPARKHSSYSMLSERANRLTRRREHRNIKKKTQEDVTKNGSSSVLTCVPVRSMNSEEFVTETGGEGWHFSERFKCFSSRGASDPCDRSRPSRRASHTRAFSYLPIRRSDRGLTSRPISSRRRPSPEGQKGARQVTTTTTVSFSMTTRPPPPPPPDGGSCFGPVARLPSPPHPGKGLASVWRERPRRTQR